MHGLTGGFRLSGVKTNVSCIDRLDRGWYDNVRQKNARHPYWVRVTMKLGKRRRQYRSVGRIPQQYYRLKNDHELDK